MLNLKNLQTPDVENLSLTVPSGTMTTLFCTSDTARKHLCEVLSGARLPDKGTLSVNDIDLIAHPSAYAGQVSLLTGSTKGLYAHLTVLENLLFFGKLHRLSQDAITQYILQQEDPLHLSHFLHVRVRDLSLTHRQQAHFVLGLLHAPTVLVLLNPFEMPSPELIFDFISFIQTCKAQGKAIVCVTDWLHDLPGFLKVCDTVGILHNKKLLHLGSPKEVLSSQVCGDIKEAQLFLRNLQNHGMGGASA